MEEWFAVGAEIYHYESDGWNHNGEEVLQYLFRDELANQLR